MHPSPWFCLEAISGLIALETDWQQMAGEQYPGLRALCLQTCVQPVQYVRCPDGCGCNHLVLPRHDGAGALAVCQCASPRCPDLALTLPEVTPLELSFARLGHALCRAFGFAPRFVELPIPNTVQFGSWSTDAVPAILTIQSQSPAFRWAVAELAAQLRRPFILFAPTADFLDVPSMSILENHRAAFFSLDAQVRLTAHGTLQPIAVPGELFARFNPQPKDLDLDTAQRVFALVQKLDTDKPLSPPDLLAVFRHYCMEELSAAHIARKYECSKPTVLRRLKLIHARVGIAPQQLRRLSAHIAKLEESLEDSRAARVRPKAALEQEDDPES